MSTSTGAAQRIAARGDDAGRASRRASAHGASSRSRSAAARSATCTATTPPTSSSQRTSGWSCAGTGRIEEHPVFPGRNGPAARRIADERRHRATCHDDAAQLRPRRRRPARRRARTGGMSVAIVTGASRGLGLALTRELYDPWLDGRR